MGITKTTLFSTRQNEVADLARAVGHPARVAILEHLLWVNACICTDLVDALPLAQPTISQHLRALKEAGLIRGSIEGNAICYCIEDKAIRRLRDFFGRMHDKLNTQNENCC